jgi:hypothetical protein
MLLTIEVYPCLVIGTTPTTIAIGMSAATRTRVSRDSLDALRESHEEGAQDRNGPKDENEPHFRQNPGIELGDGVRLVGGFGDGGYGDCLVDPGYSCSVETLTLAKVDIDTRKDKY